MLVRRTSIVVKSFINWLTVRIVPRNRLYGIEQLIRQLLYSDAHEPVEELRWCGELQYLLQRLQLVEVGEAALSVAQAALQLSNLRLLVFLLATSHQQSPHCSLLKRLCVKFFR